MRLIIYHCDALLPQAERYSSPKFRRLSRWFDPYKVDHLYLLELTIFADTPGIHLIHLDRMFQWDKNMIPTIQNLVLPHYRDEAAPYIQANLGSIQQEDGAAILRAMLDNPKKMMGTVPLYATRYLQARRLRGSTARQLAREFNTSVARIERWWRADLFDPLSGVSRETYRDKRVIHHPGVTI